MTGRTTLIASAGVSVACGALAAFGHMDAAGLVLNAVAAGAALLPQKLRLEGEHAIRSVSLPARTATQPAGLYVVTAAGTWEMFPAAASDLLDHPRPLSDPRGDALWHGRLTLVEIGARVRVMLRPSVVTEPAAVAILAAMQASDRPATIRQFDGAEQSFARGWLAVAPLAELLSVALRSDAATVEEIAHEEAPETLRKVAGIIAEHGARVDSGMVARIRRAGMMSRSSLYLRGLGRPKVAHIGDGITMWGDWPRRALGRPYDDDHPYPAVIRVTGAPMEDVGRVRFDRISAVVDGKARPYRRLLAPVTVDGKQALWNATVRG